MNAGTIAARWIPAELATLARREMVKASKASIAQAVGTDQAAFSKLGRSATAEIAAFNAPILKKFPDLLPMKYQAMAVDAFGFFRGTDHLFYHDLKRLSGKEMQSGPWAPLQGDLHPCNFGTLQSSTGKLAVGMNDYDEAYVGPVQLDIKRLAAGIGLAGNQAKLNPADVRAAIEGMAGSYRDEIARLVAHPHGPTPAQPDSVSKLLEEANATDPKAWLDKVAPAQNGTRALARKASVASVSPQVRADLEKSFARYEANLPAHLRKEIKGFKISDAVSAVAGTGSIGRARYRLLLTDPKGDARVFEIKEEVPAAMARYLPWHDPFAAQADRDLFAESLMSGDADAWMGHATLPSRDALESRSFLVRRVLPSKAAIDPTTITNPKDFQDLMAYYGTLIARGHASGEKAGLASPERLLEALPDKATLAKSLGDFGQAYAQQVQRDWLAFKTALTSDPLLRNVGSTAKKPATGAAATR